MPEEKVKPEVEKSYPGETEAWETVYVKLYKSQIQSSSRQSKQQL